MSASLESPMKAESAKDSAADVGVDDAELPPLDRSMLWKVLQIPVWIISTLVFDLKVFGKQNVPGEGGVLLLSNHQSFLDPPLVAVKLRRPVCFLARSGLFKPPGFGWLIRSLNAFPVDPRRGVVGAMKRSIKLTQTGRALLIFPEGARTTDGSLQPIASGAALVVKRAKVPVVPVAIHGAYRAWPRHRLLPRAARVRVMYGKPLLVHELEAGEIVKQVSEQIESMLRELKSIDER